MRVIIAGSRTITDRESVHQTIEESGFAPTVVLCGGAEGVDKIGKTWAIERNILVEYYLADWLRYGKKAGPLRNRKMAQNADALVLVWDGQSKGSKNMLDEANSTGLKIFERVICANP